MNHINFSKDVYSQKNIPKISVVITTIQSDTEALSFYRKIKNINLLLIGDKKTPKHEDIISLEQQESMSFNLIKSLPINHYCRKNVGYLESIKNNSDLIYDTDDDNIPMQNFKFIDHKEFNTLLKNQNNEVFFNIYDIFLPQRKIWARGFPLNRITKKSLIEKVQGKFNIGVWQGMVEGDPDVDSIYRLTNKHEEIRLQQGMFALEKNSYSPFNSQCTLWNKSCFPLLYLPITVSFRFTDILRSYIAQKIMWHHELYLGFHSSMVYQKRNAHNLMKDFADEIPMFTYVENIVEMFNSLNLTGSMTENLYIIYELFYKEGIVKAEELVSVSSWIKDIINLQNK